MLSNLDGQVQAYYQLQKNLEIQSKTNNNFVTDSLMTSMPFSKRTNNSTQSFGPQDEDYYPSDEDTKGTGQHLNLNSQPNAFVFSNTQTTSLMNSI